MIYGAFISDDEGAHGAREVVQTTRVHMCFHTTVTSDALHLELLLFVVPLKRRASAPADVPLSVMRVQDAARLILGKGEFSL